MRIHHKLIAGGALIALMSGTALARSDVHFGLSIGVPVAPVYVAPAPAYYPPPGYYAAPPVGYAAPPQVYYRAPAPAYYDAAPGYSLYYGRRTGSITKDASGGAITSAKTTTIERLRTRL